MKKCSFTPAQPPSSILTSKEVSYGDYKGPPTFL